MKTLQSLSLITFLISLPLGAMEPHGQKRYRDEANTVAMQDVISQNRIAHILGTSLIAAAKSGDIVGGNLLLASGADINTTDNEGRTPLLVAVEYGHLEMVSMLLAAGATIERKYRCAQDLTVLGLALQKCEDEQDEAQRERRIDIYNLLAKRMLNKNLRTYFPNN